MASTYLYRQCDATASSGYSTTWTWSGWVKRSRLGSPEQGIFMNKKDSDNTASRFRMSFGSSDKLLWECKDSTNSDDNSFQTNMEFRDTNAWYHIVFSYDSTQSTEADRLKLWVNGVDIRNNGGGFASIDEASNGFGTLWSSASKHYLGRTSNNSGTAHYFDGYMSHVHLTYGTTYPASTFGSTDATTGEWKINTNPNVTYGSQGYFMLKNDNSVTDQSGEGNNFTASGTLTKSEDNPSNVFSTIDLLSTHASNYTFANGNNKVTNSNGSTRITRGTLGASSGKYYFETKIATVGGSGGFGTGLYVGVTDADYFEQLGTSQAFIGTGPNQVAQRGDGSHLAKNNTQINGYESCSAGSILQVALDLDNGYVYFGVNGTWGNSGDPTSGSSGTGGVSITTGKTYMFAASGYNGWSVETNFGNGYFGTTAISSEGTNASNIGKFEYNVPTGYTALSTKGLNE